MNPAIHAFFEWLLRATSQAAIITVLILVAQICLRKRLDARWRHLLWLLVLVRLAMPVSLPSPTSLFNIVPVEPAAVKSAMPPKPASTISIAVATEPEPIIIPLDEPATISIPPTPSQQPTSNRPPATHWAMPSWPVLLALTWMLGVCGLVARTMIQNIRFARRLRRGRLVNDPRTLTILQDCKSLMGVRTTVVLLETDAVKSPALYGLFRQRLLMPTGLIDSFSTPELRHVLLHELAHVRRRDMLVQWFVTLFQIVHWFNPILWFGFRRMAADRELACDDLALSVVGESEGRAYGQTIVKLLEACSEPPALPALVGILEDKAQMFQRIAMIARFKQRSRWSFVGIVAAIVLALATLTGAQTKSTDEKNTAVLSGTVQLTNGQPADATVFIYTAGPKTGTSPFCPSCYPDCRKSAKTDKQGHFKIESLDPELLFRLLVVGKDSQPVFVADVDPAKEPVHVTLQRQNPVHVPRDQTVRGRIVDGKGAPIKWATIEGRRVLFRDGNTGKPTDDIDPLAVSDDRGEFILTARRPVVSLSLVVEAPGYAKRTFPNVTTGTAQEFTMTEGAVVEGQVTLNGKPMPNVSVGIVSADRTIDNYTGEYEVGTDTSGTFLFRNLPANVSYEVCGLMKSLHTRGATKILTVSAGGDGTVTEAGELAVEAGFHISGRVVLADGKPIPTKSKISVGRQRGGWDAQSVDLGLDGSFDVDGVPAGIACVTARIGGYHPSVKNESLDSLNPIWLLGRVNQDVSGLVILMEKGQRLESYFDGAANGVEMPENRPLTGAEHAADHSRDRMISGQVTDKETGQPVVSFKITPGRPVQNMRPDFNWHNWNPQRAVNGTNGFYSIDMAKTSGSIALMIEAPGYLPMESPNLPVDQTNFDFAMSKGSGPSGVALLPDGKPAAGASVTLVRPMGQSTEVQLNGRGKFDAYRHPEFVTAADASGHFSLQPALGMDSVAVCAQEGFKMVSLDVLATNQQITLEPWGKVKGTIRRGGHPSVAEKLYLSFGGTFKGKSLGMFIGTATDDKGNFEFDFAPPGDCQIFAETPTEDMPARLTTEKEFHVEAGQTAKLEIDAAEKPVVDLARASQRAQRYNEIPSKTLKGFVVSPDGKPVADTQVGIADQEHNLQIGDGELVAGPINPNVARTDQNGAFNVPWPSSATKLYVANAEGVASLNIGAVTNGIHVVLQPWASVEGIMRRNGQPDAGASVHLHEINDGVGWQVFHADVTADSNGHFVISHVLPGSCGLGRWTDMGNGSKSMSDLIQFDLAPGESTNVTCGGDGRPVTGTLELTFANDVPTNIDLNVTIHTALPRPGQKPGDTHTLTSTEYRKWQQSVEGKLAWATYHAYVGRVAVDRSFQVEDVPPGHYEISLNGHRFSPDGPATFIEGIFAVTNIIVPALADPTKCESYNLGQIKVTAKTASWPNQTSKTNTLIKVGDMAPAISTATHDGKPLHLLDYRGKFVLLDFRVMLPGREMDSLQSVNNAFAKDDRFVTISLAQTIDDDYVKQIADKGLTQWIVGDLDYAKLSESYGLNMAAFPYIALVGPDGKIMATQLTGDSIYATVAQALGKK